MDLSCVKYKLSNREFKWRWNELKYGVDNNIIADRELVGYAKSILNEDMPYFDIVLEVTILNKYEDVYPYLSKLVEIENQKGFPSMNYAQLKKVEQSSIFSLYKVEEYGLYDLTNLTSSQEQEFIKSKWLYAVLDYVYNTRNQYTDVQGIIDWVYGEFGYPSEISSLSTHWSEIQDVESLRKLKKYLDRKKEFYQYYEYLFPIK